MTDARDPRRLEEFLAGARVDGAVAAPRPDYRALLIAVEGITPSASDAASEALLARAETLATELLSDPPADRKSVAQLGRFPQHREAKGEVQRWYGGYRIVASDIRATYGDGRLPAPAAAHPSADQEQP